MKRGCVTLLLLAVGCSSGIGGSPGPGGAGGRGGAAGGGAGTGGSVTAGAAGTATGGSATGGSATGGSATGGSAGGAAWLTPPPVPATLAVPTGAVLAIHDHAVGQQIYTCTAASSGGAGGGGAGGAGGAGTSYAWVLKQPDAKLYDMNGTQVGTHDAGPKWTSTDGSVANGTKIAQADSPQSDAIPWLLLKATPSGSSGVFSPITYVQRANTVGGKAPATGCDATAVNTDTGVEYSADYYFYTGGGSGAAWLTLPANVPAAIAVPTGTTLKLHDHAIGAQIYTCTASTGAAGADGAGAGGAGGAATYSWMLKAPDAILYDETFKQVGTHGAGPKWTSTVDGSVVNGTKVAQATPVAGAIPWLLLMAASTTGSGVFSDVTYVQRLATVGGVAPMAGCDATTEGADTRVGYSADYYFFTGGGAGAGGAGGAAGGAGAGGGSGAGGAAQ